MYIQIQITLLIQKRVIHLQLTRTLITKSAACQGTDQQTMREVNLNDPSQSYMIEYSNE